MTRDPELKNETAPPGAPAAPALPPEIAGRLAAFERRLRAMETLVAAFGGLCGVLLAYALVFVSDRFWDTPAAVRAIATLAGGGAVAFGAWYWVRRWWWRRRDARALARLVQRHYPRLGDRLLGAVELAGGEGQAGLAISPALCRAALRQVAREAGQYDFTRAAPTRRPRQFAIGAALLVAAVAAIFALAPLAGFNALTRWMKPLAHVERFTFVSLEAMPAELVVPHGEGFEVACALAAGSRWRPGSAACRLDDQPRIEAAVRGGQAVFRLPGQTRRGVLRLRIGDVTREMAIVPLYRPELLALAAEVALPSYLRRANELQPVANGRARFLRGSAVRFAARANRVLDSASLRDGARTAALAVTGETFRTAVFPADGWAPAKGTNGAAAEPALVFSWRDRHGLDCTTPYRLTVGVEDDAAPTLQCEGLRGSVAILEDEVIDLKVRADDDYGVQRLWVDWSIESGPGSSGAVDVVRSTLLTNGAPDRRSVSGEFRFSPTTLKVPEESTVQLSAAALDYLPGRSPAHSAVYRIYVLSRAQHAKLLQERLQALQAHLEDIAREEERRMVKNAEISARPAEEMRGEKSTAELQETERGERLDARQLEQMAKDLEALLKEALRNKDIADATLRDWAKLAESLRQLAGTPMPQAAQSLQQAQAEPGRRGEHLKQALQLQREILEAMRAMLQRANLTAEQLAAQSFVNRLRDAAGREGQVATQVQEWLPILVGLPAEQIPAALRDQAGLLAARQQATGRDVLRVRDDLAGFFNRTRTPIYDEIRRAMAEPDVVAAMRALGQKVERNLGARAVGEARELEKQLNGWADQLEKALAKQGGGGGGGGAQQPIDPEVILGLMRARVREESLREETRALDEAQPRSAQYERDAGRLGDKQQRVGGDVRALGPKAQGGPLGGFIEKIAGLMDEVEGSLRIPMTDANTIGAETEVIETLAAAMQAAARSSPAAEQMMQSMGMGQGKKGGGSTAGGTTDDPNAPGRGAGGADGEGRRVQQGGGVDASSLPEEFRDALQGYFNGLEERK